MDEGNAICEMQQVPGPHQMALETCKAETERGVRVQQGPPAPVAMTARGGAPRNGGSLSAACRAPMLGALAGHAAARYATHRHAAGACAGAGGRVHQVGCGARRPGAPNKIRSMLGASGHGMRTPDANGPRALHSNVHAIKRTSCRPPFAQLTVRAAMHVPYGVKAGFPIRVAGQTPIQSRK